MLTTERLAILRRFGDTDVQDLVDEVDSLRAALQAKTEELRALQAQHDEWCRMLGDGWVEGSAEAELARIRPVYQAACAWLDCRYWSESKNEVPPSDMRLANAIDTARASERKGGGE